MGYKSVSDPVMTLLLILVVMTFRFPQMVGNMEIFRIENAAVEWYIDTMIHHELLSAVGDKDKNNKSRGTNLLLLLSFIDRFNNPIQQLCKFSIKTKIKVDTRQSHSRRVFVCRKSPFPENRFKLALECSLKWLYSLTVMSRWSLMPHLSLVLVSHKNTEESL